MARRVPAFAQRCFALGVSFRHRPTRRRIPLHRISRLTGRLLGATATCGQWERRRRCGCTGLRGLQDHRRPYRRSSPRSAHRSADAHRRDRALSRHVAYANSRSRAVCIENLIRFDWLTELASVDGDDRADPPVAGRSYGAVDVEGAARGRKHGTAASADRAPAKAAGPHQAIKQRSSFSRLALPAISLDAASHSAHPA